MALLTRVALEQPEFARLVSTREATVKVWQSIRKRRLVVRPRLILSHNRLLGRLEGADGVKTGYTDGAGRCLVASATRRDQRMIAVLLNDPERWSDAAALLEYGFQVVRGSARLAPRDGRVALDVMREVHP
jgi:D-alanyl-D-alanine carboxypeptidase (penicillin-binding protein 5/6)